LNPNMVIPMPGGRTSFGVSANGNYISVYDLSVLTEIYRIQNEPALTATLTSDSSQLIVSRKDDPTKLDVFDTSTFALVKTIPLTGFTSPVTNMFVVGNNLFLMRGDAHPIYVVNLTTNGVTTLSNIQTYGSVLSRRFGLTPDGGTVVAVGGGDPVTPASVYLINATNLAVIESLPLPDNTNRLSVAVTPVVGAAYAYITMDSTLQLLDVSVADPMSGQFVPGISIPLPLSPTSSTITSDGVTLAMVQSDANADPNIAVMPTASAFTGGSINSTETGIYAGVIADTQASFLPASNAPQMGTISPSSFVNNTSNVLQITGSGFSSDAVVKIGSANPIVPSSVTSTQITVTVPPFTPSGNLNVVVINQNAQGPLSGRNVASLPNQVYVTDGPGFNPKFDTFAVNYGDGSIYANGSYQSALAGAFSNTTTSGNPSAIVALTNDSWFVTSKAYSSVDEGYSSCCGGSVGLTSISLPGNVAFGDAIALTPDPITGRTVTLVPSSYPQGNGIDWQLNIIDADPYSPTYSTVVRWYAANTTNASTTPAAFAATPDGKFAYQQVVLNDGTSDLVVYDVSGAQQPTLVTGIGLDPVVHGMQVSPDGKYLAIANLTSNNILVFDITNRTSPTQVGTIPIANPNGVALTDCCNLRIANNTLYAFDPATTLVQAFNFQPASSNYSPIGTVQLPGNPDPDFQGGLAVSPDGAYVYAAEVDDDAIDVLDTTQIATGDINQALVTRLSTEGIGPVSIAVNPSPTSSAYADLTVASSHSTDPSALGDDLVYTVTATNLGPDTSGTVVITDTLPAGFALSDYSSPNGDVTCSGSSVVSCTMGPLSANGSNSVFLTVSTSGVAAVGQYTNVVTVGQTGQVAPDNNPGNNTATDITNLAEPDLAISATADNTGPAVGGVVNFTINVINNGTVTATNVTVTGSLSAGTISSAGECSFSGANFSCSLGPLAPGSPASVVVTATMPNTAGAVSFNASVSEFETDANPQDNVITPILITVGGGADLVLTPAGAPVSVGNVPTYTVVVKNNGPDPAIDAVVSDALDRFQFVSAVSSVGSCSFDGVNVKCPLGTLAVGASATVNVSVNPPSSGWASNDFHASSDTLDPVPTNNVVNMGPFGGSIGNTTAGPNVLVDALDSTSGLAVNFLFANVTKPGLTKVTSVAGTQPPSGYRFGSPALVYDLSTTASYSGAIRVSLRLAGMTFHHPNEIRLFHMENGTWVDRTAALDTASGMITGVTGSLSPFVVVEPLNSVPVANAGADETLPGASSSGATVTLNGAASTDADNDPLTYTWTGPFPEGNGTVTGVNPKVTLPLGLSKVMLVVNDGEDNSTPAAVNVTVSDFLLAPPASQIVLVRGGSTSFNVVLTPKYGSFDQAVTIACGNVPAGLTCNLANGSVTPGAQGTTATVTLTASASAGLRTNRGPLFAFWLGGLPVFGILFTGKLKRNRRGVLILLALLVFLIVGMMGCGGAGSSSVTQSPTPSSTSTSVTLTATSGGLQHSSTVTVVIQ